MGGGGSTEQQSSTQSVNQVQLPPWINDAAQQNYALAQNIAERPLQQYQGQQVADIGPQTQQAWNLAATSGGAGADQYNAAQAGYLGVLGQQAPQFTAAQASLAAPVTAAQAATAQAKAAAPTVAQQAALSQLNGMNLQGYMNPYVSSVIQSTLPIMQQQLALSQNQQQNAANSANAFGGSRQAIQQGVTQAQGAQNMAQMAAQLNQANFQQAQQAGEFDVGQANQLGEFNANQLNQVGMYNQGQANQVGLANAQMANTANQFNAGQSNQVNLADMSAANAMAQFNAGAQNQVGLANQQAGLTQEQLGLSAAGGLGALGNQAQQNQRQQFLELSTAGAQEQQQAQNQIQANINQFNQANQYPTQQLGVLQSALGMTPYGSTSIGSSSTSQEQQTNPSLAQTVYGGLQALGGMAGAGGPLGVGGLFNPTGTLFQSDRHLKTDIKQTGVHPPTGLPMYSYRYKGDPKSYPKVVGPMAEDAMQVAPHAVTTVGIHQPTGQAIHGVDMNALNATPAIRPQRMPGAGGSFATRVPGALTPRSPQGLTGALGSNMRTQRMRPNMPMPRVAGAMGGLRG